MKNAKERGKSEEKKASEDLEILGNFEEIELYFARKDCPGGRNESTEAEEGFYVKVSSRNALFRAKCGRLKTLIIISYFRYNFYLLWFLFY